MRSQFWGIVLLIVGTSIGAGMLALPIVLRGMGFLPAALLLISAWFVMAVGAMFILEVNLMMPRQTNLISMTRQTLGRCVEVVVWVCYLLLHYCLLSAYIAGGAELVMNVFHVFHGSVSHAWAIIIFMSVFGLVVYHGVRTVDLMNRGLMLIKLGSFALLGLLLMQHVHPHWLMHSDVAYLSNHLSTTVMVVITSFGFAVIVPSLRDYFGENDHLMLKAIMIGSLIPLCCYLLWIAVIMGTVPASQSVSGLAALLQKINQTTHSSWVNQFAHLFSYVCVTTSFLGVSLALMDFLADGFRLPGTTAGRGLNMVMAFGPPIAIVMLNPHLFVTGLSLAGVFCVILLIALPAGMMWRMQPQWRWLVGVEIMVLALLMLMGAHWLWQQYA